MALQPLSEGGSGIRSKGGGRSYEKVQYTATHCNALSYTLSYTPVEYQAAAWPSGRCLRGGTRLEEMQHITKHCNTLQRTATHCNTLQHAATRCNTLQHTATHCNTLQHKSQIRYTHRNRLFSTTCRKGTSRMYRPSKTICCATQLQNTRYTF